MSSSPPSPEYKAVPPIHNGRRGRRFSGKGAESIFLGAVSTGKMNLLDKNWDSLIIALLLATPVWTLFFTALPIMISFKGVGADVYRILEPIVGIPLMYFILVSSEVYVDYSEQDRKLFKIPERTFCSIVFMIGAALYAQGSGIHAAAIMAKHNLENLVSSNPNITSQYPGVQDSVVYMQQDLEHVIGHYIYAAGAIIMTWSYLIAYRRQRHDEVTSFLSLFAWILGSIFNALLLAGVAIEFPKGTIVGLIYLLGIGIPLLMYLVRLGHLFTKGRRLVLQYYTFSVAIALLILIIWIGVNHGFVDRKSAGLFD